MTMTNRANIKHDSIILATLESLVPQDHPVRKLEAAIDWQFIYPLAEPLYSGNGRPSIDPVVLFKMILINYCFGYNSMRKTCREIEVNVAYRWFLGYEISEAVPNYSTWSQNYLRRYGDSGIFDAIFDRVLQEAMDCHFVKLDTVFGDGTHMKANANRRKSTQEEVEVTKRAFEEDLLEEINRDRKAHGKAGWRWMIWASFSWALRACCFWSVPYTEWVTWLPNARRAGRTKRRASSLRTRPKLYSPDVS